MKKYIIVFLMAFLCQYTTAQVIGEVNVLDRDLFYLQYTPPNVISNDFSYQKWSTKLNIPPIRLNKLSIFNTIGLDLHRFDYNNSNKRDLRNSSDKIDLFYNINYSLFMNYRFSKKWSLNGLVASFISSNLEGKFSTDDLNFNGYIYLEHTFFRKKGGYWQLALGVAQMTLNGNTQFTPIAHIKARLNKKWSFVIGLPNTYIKWDIHEKHSIKALMDLNDFSANLSEANPFLGHLKSDKAVFTLVAVGLEYNYWIKPYLGIMFRTTQIIWSDYEIRDHEGRSSFNFDTSFKQPFISIGIKFNPIRNLQNSLNPL